METISNAMLGSWELNPSVLIPTAIFSALYARGWWQLHRRASNLFGFSQLAAFFAGLSTIVFALISPLHAFAAWLLTVHMIQHLLLMMVAPPLILWGAPYLPLLCGLPRPFSIDVIRPFLSSTVLRKIARFVSHPVFCWSAFISVNIGWHLPVLYEIPLSSDAWHAGGPFSCLCSAALF